MQCNRHTTRRLVAALLAATALSGTIPVSPATAAPAGNPASRWPTPQEAAAAVADAEAHLQAVIDLELQVRERIATLSHREASLVRQVADARDEARRWAIDAFVSDSDEWAFVLAGSATDAERSAKVVFASNMATQRSDAAERYEALRAQVTPELAELADGLAEVEAARRAANDAVLAARAMEAEVERQIQLAEERRARAEAARRARLAEEQRAALARSSTSDPAAGASATGKLGVADDGLQGPAAPAGGPTEAQWERLRQCESSGNYQAVSRSGKYRGAYQFDRQTWATLGPPGDPAAASPAEQDRRAKLLYAQRGWRPWPHCGKYLR